MVHSGKEIQREVRSQIKEVLHMPPSPVSRIPLAGCADTGQLFHTTLLFKVYLSAGKKNQRIPHPLKYCPIFSQPRFFNKPGYYLIVCLFSGECERKKNLFHSRQGHNIQKKKSTEVQCNELASLLGLFIWSRERQITEKPKQMNALAGLFGVL